MSVNVLNSVRRNVHDEVLLVRGMTFESELVLTQLWCIFLVSPRDGEIVNVVLSI